MNDMVDASTNKDDDTQLASAVASLGLLLQDAREKRKLSIEDVSNRLRISLRQVKALEADDFGALPEAMITRGFIRNYARLLDIDAEPLLAAYRTSAPVESAHAISIQSEHVLILGGDKRPWRMYIIASLLIAAMVGAWLVFVDYRPQLPTQSVPVASTESNSAGGSPPANSAVEQKPQSDSLPIPALPAAERMPQENAAADTSAAIPGATNTVAGNASAKLKFNFVNPTWLSVKDHKNKSVVNKNKPAGSEEIVEGEPPFKIIIGNATGSTLIYNDKPIDLGPYTKSNIARLTLE